MIGTQSWATAVRARSVDSASEGAPARTGRGPCAGRGAGAGFDVATARGFAAAFGFAAARGFGFVFVAVADLPFAFFRRSPPNRVGRVAGRLPRTLSSSVFSVISPPVYVSRAPVGAPRS